MTFRSARGDTEVIWQQTPKNMMSYVFTLIAWKVAKRTAHQKLIFKVQKPVEAII
jgi:hypothetical protein